MDSTEETFMEEFMKCADWLSDAAGGAATYIKYGDRVKWAIDVATIMNKVNLAEYVGQFRDGLQTHQVSNNNVYP